jgi:hypothetical protein
MTFLKPHTTENLAYYTFLNVIGFFVNMGVVFGPSIGYITQSLKFYRLGSSYGFNLTISLKILTANIFRIFFWIGKRFNIYLLYQSILVISFQFIVITFYIIYKDHREKKKDNNLINPKEKISIKFKKFFIEYFHYDNFWNWDFLFPYFIFTFLFVGALLGVSLIFGFKNPTYVNLLGIISTGIEVILGIPQIITNYQLKSGDALSIIMICSWIFGDIFKTGYYIVTKCPPQFVVCGILQALINIIIICQIFYYHKGPYNFLQLEVFGFNKKNNGPFKEEEKILDGTSISSYDTFDKSNKENHSDIENKDIH